MMPFNLQQGVVPVNMVGMQGNPVVSGGRPMPDQLFQQFQNRNVAMTARRPVGTVPNVGMASVRPMNLSSQVQPSIVDAMQRNANAANKIRPEGSQNAPLFAIAPQQSARCFSVQQMHGLLDPNVVFSGGLSGANTMQIPDNPASVFVSRDYSTEINTITTEPTLSNKSKLQSLLAEIDPAITIDTETEQVYWINYSVYYNLLIIL
jgi:hypothetical protein